MRLLYFFCISVLPNKVKTMSYKSIMLHIFTNVTSSYDIRHPWTSIASILSLLVQVFADAWRHKQWARNCIIWCVCYITILSRDGQYIAIYRLLQYNFWQYNIAIWYRNILMLFITAHWQPYFFKISSWLFVEEDFQSFLYICIM